MVKHNTVNPNDMKVLLIMNAICVRLTIVCMVCLFTCSCKSSKGSEFLESREVSIHVDTLPETFSTLFCDVELIPLNNEKEGMLSNVERLKKRGKYYCILDDGASPKICLYSMEGAFLKKISAMGHSRNEYICLTDVAFGDDKIVVLDRNHIVKVFDYDNHFLLEKDLGEDMYFKTIEVVAGGYVCTSPHLGGGNSNSHLLYFYDENFNLCSPQIESLPVSIHNAPFTKDTFHSDKDYYFFYDFFRSMLFKGDIHTHALVDAYTFKIPRLPSSSDFINERFYKDLANYDSFTKEYILGNKLYAYISYNDIMSSLIVDLDEENGTVFHYCDWYPRFYDDNGDFVYSIIPADMLLALLDNESYIPAKTRSILSECIYAKTQTVQPTDNFIIVKMKLK